MAIFKTIEDFLRKSVYTGPLAKEKPTRAPGSKGYKPTDTSGKKFKPAYMKTVKTKPANIKKSTIYKPNPQAVPGRKAITETRTGPGRVTSVPKTGKLKGILSNYSDGPNQKVLRGQFKENLSKIVSQDSKPNKSNAPRPEFNKKKKSNKRVHYATMMAKKLMGGGTKRY
jgi:hypothetical protein